MVITPDPAAKVSPPLTSPSSAPPTPSPRVEPGKAILDSVTLDAPSVNQLRTEVAANPHETPPSVLSFAAELAPRMAAALHSSEKAHHLWNELEKCTSQISSPTVIRSICLSNINILADHYSWQEKYQDLLGKVNPEVKRLSAQ
jgi:hypothetical protein